MKLKQLFVALNAVLAFALIHTSAQAAAEVAGEAKKAVVAKAASKSPKAGGMEKKVLARFREKYPATQVSSVTKAEVKGLYEVVMGSNVAYTDADAKFLFIGHMIDMKTQTDLTQARIDDLSRVNFSSLPFEKAIKVVKGNGLRTFAVFTDPDCPYCKKLEESLSGVDNFTMYVFMFPIAGLHPEAETHAATIWCAKDRAAAWSTFMLMNQLPATGATCANPVQDLIALGQSMGVQGTPTMFRADGARMPGYLPGPQLNDWLNGKSVR